MCEVIINGAESNINGNGLQKLADLIELIKNSIDPDHMITGILVDGRELEDSDWQAGLGKFETAIVEIQTDTPHSYVSGRLGAASAIVRACFLEFRDGRKHFQDGKMQEGNQCLLQAVNTLQAFFEWYGTMTELLPPDERPAYRLDSQIGEITDVCRRICQQQLYQSWWALGETIQNELEPKLDKLEDFCRKFANPEMING